MRSSRPSIGTVAKNAPIAGAPSKRMPSGGIVRSASSASSATMRSRSTAAHASWNCRLTRASAPPPAGAWTRASVPAARSRSSRARALQRAVDRGDALAQDVGDLAGRPPEGVAQHEDRALAGRQDLHGGDERQPDALARDRLLRRVAIWRAQLVQETVGVRLEVGVDLRRAMALALLDHP